MFFLSSHILYYKKFKYYRYKMVAEYPNCDIKENNKEFFLYEYPNINK